MQASGYEHMENVQHMIGDLTRILLQKTTLEYAGPATEEAPLWCAYKPVHNYIHSLHLCYDNNCLCCGYQDLYMPAL